MSAILFPKVIRPEGRRRKWRRERKEKREGGRHRRLQAICPSVHPGSDRRMHSWGARALRHRDWLQMSERGGADWEERAGGKR